LCALAAVILAVPTIAFADFADKIDRGRAQASGMTTQQLDALNTKVFSDAFIAAKIIGYDPAAIEQLRSEVRQQEQKSAPPSQ
jgi:hypothetical protein